MKRSFPALLLLPVILSLSAAVFSSEVFAQKRGSYRASGADFGGEEFRIYDLINDRRRKSRLRQLEWDDRVAELARRYSEDMARGNFFSHYDRRGRSVVDRAENFGLRGWSMIGENLFLCEGYDEFSGLAVRGWLRSSSHRKNMLNPQWTTTGIGVAGDRFGRIYVTQVFLK